jgi:hypothetical protein
MYYNKNHPTLMRNILSFGFIALIMFSCTQEKQYSSVDAVNWQKRMVERAPDSTMEQGVTYLSVYSQIYSQNEHSTRDLTVTVSLRNTNESDTVFIDRAAYYDTKGKLIRSYFERSIYIAPMETVEIVIDEVDREGGTGANFLFHWSTAHGLHEPHFESVMISTAGQQGISFTCRGKRLK